MSEQVKEESEGLENEPSETLESDPQYEGWLTAKEVQQATGCSQSKISRLAQQGVLIREKVGSTYLYEPNSVNARSHGPEGFDQSQVNPAATMAAQAAMLRSLAHMVPDLVDRVIKMSEVHQVVTERQDEQRGKLIQQLTERCASLEQLQTEMLVAREAHLDGAAERELAAQVAAASNARKEKVYAELLANAPALLDFAQTLLAEQGKQPTSEPKPDTEDKKDATD